MAKETEEKIHIIQTSEEAFGSPLGVSKSTRPNRKPTREELLNGHAESPSYNGFELDPRIKSPDDLLAKIAPIKKNESQTKVDSTLDLSKPLPQIISQPQQKETAQEPAPAQTPKQRPPLMAPLMNTDNNLHFGIPDLSTIKQELAQERALTEEKSSASLIAKTQGPVRVESKSKPGKTKEPTLQEKLQQAQEEITKLTSRHQKEIFQWKEYAQSVKLWQAHVLEIVKNLQSRVTKAQEKGSAQEVKELRELLRLREEEIINLQQQGKNKLFDWMKSPQNHHESKAV